MRRVEPPVSWHKETVAVELTNIGPLAAARFTVRPLTLFVGKNGAGKTLSSTLLYVLQKTIWTACDELERRMNRDLRQIIARARDAGKTEVEAEQVVAATNKALESPRFRASLEDAFKNEVLRALGEPRVFVRHGTRIARMKVKHESGWSFEAKFLSTSTSTEWTIPQVSAVDLDLASFRKRSLNVYSLLDLTRILLQKAFGSWRDRPVMIPAGRAGITDSYRYLAEQVLLERHGYTGKGISGVTRDFLATLVGSDSLSGPDSHQLISFGEGENEGLPFVTELFDKLIQGTLRPSPELDELFVFEKSGHKVDRSVLSSMVKELGPMIVLLQQSELGGTSLTVDEPECHLHPQAQIELARVFVSLVSRNVRFLLSSHSPYLAQSLSNEWITQQRTGHLVNKSMSVVSFDDHSRGGKASDLVFDGQFGFEFGEFVEAADQVQREFVELFD